MATDIRFPLGIRMEPASRFSTLPKIEIVKTLIISLALVACVGCSEAKKAASDDFTPLMNGFGFGLHRKRYSPMHRVGWADLQYQNTNGNRIVVWPYVEVEWVQITNNFAVLLGDKAKVYADGKERLAKRLIAFEAPSGPPMDITDQVLSKWCSESGTPLGNVVQNSFVGLSKTNNALRLDFVLLKNAPEATEAGDGIAIISWRDLESIIQEVKKSGKLQKEKWSGVEYLQKE